MLQNFENCPHKGMRIYIARDLPKVETPAMTLGKNVHKALANRIARGTPLPEEFSKYETLASPFGRFDFIYTELPLAIDRHGKPCGFFDDTVFMRGYGDVVIVDGEVASIFDWKTGKKREDPAELRLHALMLKARERQLTKIIGHYVWLGNIDLGLNPVGKPHDLSDVDKTWYDLNCQTDEIERMITATHFPKTPNALCGWCPVMDCEHNKNGTKIQKGGSELHAQGQVPL